MLCISLKIFLTCYPGCEHKGDWNCNKAYVGGDKPDGLSSDLVFHHSCCNMCHYTIKLSEQGELVFATSEDF